MINKNKFVDSITIEDFIFIVIVSLFVFVYPVLLTKGGELGCILSNGIYLLNNHTIYSTNIFTINGVNPYWVNVEWLSDILFAVIYRLGSYGLCIIFSAIIIASVFTATFRFMMLQYNNWLVNIIILSVGLWACSDSLQINGRIFSYLLVILFVSILSKLDNKGFNKTCVAIILVFTCIWSSLNTDFILGLIIIIIFSLSNLIRHFFEPQKSFILQSKQFFLLFIGAFLASLINPYGIKPHIMLYNYFISGLHTYNSFLNAPNFHLFSPYGYFEVIILLFVFLSIFSTYKPQLNKLLTSVFFLSLSLYSAINIPFFIIIALPIISDTINNTKLNFNNNLLNDFLNKTTVNIRPFKPILSTVSITILLAIGVFAPDINPKIAKSEVYPEKACKYIAENKLHGNVFNALGWGCFLNQKLSQKVYITERLYQHNKALLDDYGRIINIYKNYPQILDKYNIEWIIIPPDESLSIALKMNNQWKMAYKDNKCSIFVREYDLKARRNL